MNRLYDIWTRGYGESQIRRKQVAENELTRHKQLGWVLATEPLPKPSPPDIEVLELRLKDARVKVDEAKHAMTIEEARADEAARALYAAKDAVSKEPGIIAQLQRETERQHALDVARKRLAGAGNRPIVMGDLVKMANSEIGASAIRQTYAADNYVVGRTAEGDYLIAENKTLYLREKAEREAAEAAEKEKAIRARMEAKI